jgi:hypothetical protein
MKFKPFVNKLSGWFAIGVTFNWDDGIYFGVYIARWLIGLQSVKEKRAVVMPSDLIKADSNGGRKGYSVRHFD